MSYQPTPGTIPYRAIGWLKELAAARPEHEPSTSEICEALGISSDLFTGYMRPTRAHGAVHTRRGQGTRVLFWHLGDGKPDRTLDLAYRPDLERAAAEPKPEPLPMNIGFRVTLWDGHLLATGMEIRDGVAIFTPEMVRQLKTHTDWARL